MYTPVNPSFTMYKVGFKGVIIIEACFRDGWLVYDSNTLFENTPIQIYRKFHLQKLKISREIKKTLIFFIFLLKT